MKQRQRTRWIIPALIVAVIVVVAALAGVSRAKRAPKRPPRLKARTRDSAASIVFLGDSLVEAWRTTGARIWEERYSHRGAVALGFSGESARDVLRRIESGALDGFTPRLVVLLAGTNDLGSGASAAVTVRRVAGCVAAVRARFPRARTLLLGILPRGDGPRGRLQREVRAVNAALSQLGYEAGLHFLDLGDAFTTRRGAVRAELFEPDKLHLSAAGYRAWADAMAPVFNALT